MKDRAEFFFKIDGWMPEEMPMERLAEYMKDIAQLLDSKQRVHVVGIKSGSVEMVMDVNESHKEEIKQRVCDAGQGIGRQRGIAARQRIDDRLYKDGKKGRLSCDGITILRFLGRPISPEAEVGLFEKEGSFDGRVISVGGGGDLARVQLLSGDDRINCRVARDMAKKLAEHLFEGELRVSGTGERFRNVEGKWKFKQFFITGFDKLDTTPLTTLVESLRSLPGNGWEELDDPWEELRREREG